MPVQPPGSHARVPPRFVVRTAWVVHRFLDRITFGRLGVRRSSDTQWGMLRLRTTGRKTGEERMAILGYFDDGPNVVTLAMNGWGSPEPAWWLNLQAHPEARVELKDGSHAVRGRAATGEERDRLWKLWSRYNPDLEGYAAMRDGETAVVVLEPIA
jgi:deazaflavin-dependent oxidoreductase (nitroreductase family)